MRSLLLSSLAFLATACATAPEPSSGQPNLTPASGSPAPAQARLYADCITAAIHETGYDREGNTIRFHCAGAVAQRFYNGLGAWSAAHNAELTADGHTLRLTQRPERDLSGLDFCWRDASGAYGCTVVLNVGEFLGAE
jgi:hypothetical protein